MSDQSPWQGLTKLRDELKRALEVAVRRSELPGMDQPGLRESDLRQIASIETLLANIERTIRDRQG